MMAGGEVQGLAGRRVLLAVSGGIAAYKAAELVRRLREEGAAVRVVMTAHAQQFITATTLQALSAESVRSELFDSAAEQGMGHIELARWAEIILLAPATASTLARLAHGLADDLLTTLWLASPALKAVAPAMNQQMWRAAATQRNVQSLCADGVLCWGPEAGDQACGDVGPGRMREPQELVRQVIAALGGGDLSGVEVLMTAGPTREAIDPVRYISNHSSGKMGYALAAAFAARGASVTLVSGPVALPPPAGVECIAVISAEEMLQAVLARVAACQLFVACAAVADYRARTVAARKLKKSEAQESLWRLELEPTPDILATVAAQPQRPWVVGFAAETHDVENYALAKLQGKRLDMIACNDVSRADIGFAADDNALLVLWQGGRRELARASKKQIAEQLVDTIVDVWRSREG